jgi:hypothetical protein
MKSPGTLQNHRLGLCVLFAALCLGLPVFLPRAVDCTTFLLGQQVEAQPIADSLLAEDDQIMDPDQPKTSTGFDTTQPLGKRLFSRPSQIDERLEELAEEDIRQHPYLHFRRTINRQPRVGACFVFLILLGVMSILCLPQQINEAKQIWRRKFFPCFGVGFLGAVLIMALARPLILSGLGTPLALALIAMLQLGLLLGLVVSACLFGETIGGKLGIEKITWLAARPNLKQATYLLIGTLLLALALLIPGIGHFPRIGTRLVVLIGIVGLGAIMRNLKRESERV